MSPLKIEVFAPDIEEWIVRAQLFPDSPPGSISQNKPDGQREVYTFQCEPSGEESVIYRSEKGIDAASSQIRLITTEGFEEVARLKDSQSHTIAVKTDISDMRSLVRFTHQK
jgi:hypothetical protein